MIRRLLALTLFTSTFSVFTAKAAVFTSIASGNWGASSTWSVSGADPDGIPDNNDDVFIAAGTTVTNNVVVADAKSMTVNASGTYILNGKKTRLQNNFTVNGTVSGTGNFYFMTGGTISCSTVFGSAGDWYFYAAYTIASGSVITKQNYFSLQTNGSVVNNGTINLTSGSIAFTTWSNSWTNGANSYLYISQNISGPLASFSCSAVNSTVVYNNAATNIYVTAYYNLTLKTNTKTLGSVLNVLHDLSITSGASLNCNNKNVNVGGSWINTAGTNCTNMATMTFNGSGAQSITRPTPETFKNLVVAGTGTVTMATGLTTTGTVTLSSGTFSTGAFTMHAKGSTWTNNGGTMNTAATGIVQFDGVAAVTIGGTSGTIFNNVSFQNGAAITLTSAGNGCAGTTNLNSGTLDIGAFNWTQSGALFNMAGGSINSAAAGAFVFTGSSAQSIIGISPVAFGNLTINSSSTVSPSFDITVAKNFTITSGTYDVSVFNYVLNVAGNFVHNGGTFNAQVGTVNFNGSAAQTISGAAATTFYDITSNNTSGGVTQSSGLSTISDILTVNSQSFGTSGAGTIILPAPTAVTTGRIAPLGAGASLVGTGWTVQAFINGPATAYWQYLGSPVQSSTIADWDNDTRFYMSGVGGNDGNACCPIFRSVRNYNTATNSYTNVVSTGTALTPGLGFMVWMADNQSQLTAPLIFDTKGKPNFGNVNKSVSSGGSAYNLVSNPYACPVLFSSVVSASGNLGPNFLILQENGTYTTNPNGGTIAATQGFMCIATSSGNMTFTEACKNSAANPNIIREASEMNMVRIRSTNDVNGLGGEAAIQITSDAHDGYDVGPDMPYLPSPYESATNLWTTDADGKDLLCNALDSHADQLNIAITVQVNASGRQNISFSGIDRVTDYSCAWLEDLSNGGRIDLGQTDNYSFDGEAGDLHKFILHFERTGDCTLDEQSIASTLESATQVYVSNDQLRAKFYFDDITNVQVNIYDAEGREVASPEFFAVSNESVNLSNPGAHGVYFVQIIKGDEVVTKKILY